MRITSQHLYRAAAIGSALLLVYVVVALPLFRDDIFLERGTVTTGGELSVLIALLLVAFFFASICWLLLRRRQPQFGTTGQRVLLILGFLCLLLFIGEKALVDEISHEYSAKSETVGEFVILYVCLTIQFMYSIAVWKVLAARGTNLTGSV